MSHIFISYSKKNKTYARKLADHMIASGFDVWIDDRIDYGENWERVIFSAIDACAALVVIMTPESYESDWVLRECQYAEHREKPQFPLLLAGEGFPRYFTTQWADVRDGSLPPDEFLGELAERAPRKAAQGADVTPVEAKEDKPSPTPHSAETIRFRRPSAEDVSPMPPQSPTPQSRSRTPYVIGAAVVAALVLIAVLVIAAQGGGGSSTPTVTAEQVAAVTTDTPEPTRPPQTSTVPTVTRNSDWSPVIHSFNDTGMALVPPGCLMMGANGDQGQRCFDAFWIGFTEVTNYEYLQCVDAVVCTLPGDTTAYDDGSMNSNPVVYVTRDQASAFAAWAGGRLPTEAEWEYAARGPDGLLYPWGDDFDPSVVNYCDASCPGQPEWIDTDHNDGYGETAPVGLFPEGESWVGAQDMGGNVFEWVEADDTDLPVMRGGSWYSSSDEVTAITEYGMSPIDAQNHVGFRIVRDYSEQIEAVITDPQPGAEITADTEIFGTAIYSPITASSYEIEISGGQYGDEWTLLHEERYASVFNGWLEVIYPQELEPGEYRIRLRIRMIEGDDVYSVEVPIMIANS